MEINTTAWKGDYIYLLPNIAICFDEDNQLQLQYYEKYFIIKLSFLKWNFGIYMSWKKQRNSH